MTTQIPVTLLTGFLGAGKTTLLNHLLGAAPDHRFVIVENEFGDLGVDGDLVRAPKSLVFELNEGCICCTVREDLIEVFNQLATRIDEFDHVIIETSGLADPEPVMKVFEIASVRSTFTLSGVVTVVDAGHLEQSLADVEACAEQITYADVLVLNKMDRLPASALGAVESRLQKLNPLAQVIRTEYGRIPLACVLEMGRRRMGPDLGGHDHSAHHHHHHHNAHHHNHHNHHHDEAIQSVAVEVDGDMNVGALDRWLGDQVRRDDQVLLRMKGVLAIWGQPVRFVFHGVRQVVDVRPDRPWGEEPRHSRVVFIGKGLNPDALRAGLISCLHQSQRSAS